MFLSRGNLSIVAAASTDAFDRGLNGLRVEVDGTTVAGNGEMLIAVAPVNERTVQGFPNVGHPEQVSAAGVVLKADHVDDALKAFPRDKRATLQHAMVTECTDPAKIELTTTDTNGRTKKIADLPKGEPYPDWRAVMRAVMGQGGRVRVCVNGENLRKLLDILLKACPDKGDENPVYLEISGKGVVLRGQNRETGQRAMAVANAYNTGGHWLENTEWEESISGQSRSENGGIENPVAASVATSVATPRPTTPARRPPADSPATTPKKIARRIISK